MDNALDDIKLRHNIKNFSLVGYSGGGAIVVLLAARRDDVSDIRTIAGNLDSGTLSSYHKVSKLEGSLDPIERAKSIANIPQIHFVGSADKTVPESIARSFVKEMGEGALAKVVVVPGVTHCSGWEENWPKLIDQKFQDQFR